MKPTTIAIAAAVILGALTLGGAAALASDDRDRDHDRDHDRRRERGGAVDPTYAKECGACHLAYPPSMLPAGGWRAVLGGLDRHFGQNAELDEATRARLEGYLAGQAGGGDGADQRITRTAWFLRRHHEVPAGVASRSAVGSMANCGACHQDAARWDFDEHRVRIPR